jgi:peptidyl-prolyl cis-trans isomerase C
MFKLLLATLAVACSSAALAQNIAVVNGKSVPKARVDGLVERVKQQAAASGRPAPPELEERAKEQVVLSEIFTQEAERRGLQGSAEYRAQMDFARQQILIQALWKDQAKKSPVSDADAKAEYDKLKAQNTGTEYRARHILVDKEDEAKAILAQLKGGAKFDDLAKKHSKDTGSAKNGGDLDFAKPEAYVPEFGQAMASLKKGEMTTDPVKSQFGFHIIKLDDTREAQFPPYDEVKAQVQQRLEQQKLQQFQETLRKQAKTDFKFGGQ